MLASFLPNTLNPTLAIQIADQIGAAIMEEQFAPGERIREVNLASMFNVSRATVRDALRILESRGLVNITPQRGARVTLLSMQELHNLFEIRAVLLALASRRAAGNYQPADGPRLKGALAQLKRSISNPTAYARASAAMVSEVARLSGSEQLTEMIASFAQRIGRYARLGLVTQKRRNRSFTNWTALVAAILARNEDLAEATHRRLALENREAAMMEIEARACAQADDGVRKARARKARVVN
ncbi:GntR family transcriptional regulator [Acidiphilium sp. AL]|uniref:GntR family transcriptional regulator n=1 Tax=Acidiphilium sp. AL TaxID=2871704 RepID=UPI0021CB53E4|nr:GntR family transcriptional regulator [Acidiphilium sp. AL]MCU4161938.1 GntR family transcriptional regulator [Acidiphilium sp. AL]